MSWPQTVRHRVGQNRPAGAPSVPQARPIDIYSLEAGLTLGKTTCSGAHGGSTLPLTMVIPSWLLPPTPGLFPAQAAVLGAPKAYG